MKFSCDRCDAQYMISDDKVGPKGVRVRCKKCGNVIPVRRPVENGAVAPEQPALAPTTTPIPGGLDVELGQAFDQAFGEGASGAEATAEQAADGVIQAIAGAEASAPLPDEDEALPAASSRTPAPARTPVPAPAATEWYVAIGQAQVGPLPLEDVRRKWEVADVGPDSLVWRPGMGDWAPLSSVADLAAYLAPFPVAPRQSRTPAPAASPLRAEPSRTPAATPAPGDVSWKPVGASALAALASEEIATRTTPEPRPVGAARAPAASTGGVRSLVEQMDLPDGGGVDPTGAIPLPMKALETTGEHRMERVSSVARGAEQIRHRRSAARGLTIAVVAILLLGAAGAAAWYKGLIPGLASPSRTEPVVAAAPAPQPAPPPAAPEPQPAVAAAAPVEPEPAKAEEAAPAPVAAAAEPATATPEPATPAPEPEPAKAAPPPRKTTRTAQRLAQATAPKAPAPTPEPAPAPAPARRRDVLDFESNDAALEAALGSSKPTGSRSVYVPPPPSGSALQQRVTDSQVNETILGRVSALQRCVQEQKARDAEATGVMKMRWTIAPDGSVRDAKCVTPEFASSAIAGCVSGVLKDTRFPQSKLGRQDVTFPIKF